MAWTLAGSLIALGWAWRIPRPTAQTRSRWSSDIHRMCCRATHVWASNCVLAPNVFHNWVGLSVKEKIGRLVKLSQISERENIFIKVTCREIIIFIDERSKHLYPLWLDGYPKKTHGVDRGASL